MAVSVLGENHFRKSFSPKPACLAVTENDFRLTNIFTFDPEMIFFPHFHFKAFPEKERERESARARERRRNIPVSPTIASGLRAPGGTDLASSSPTIAAKIAVDGAISQSVDRDLGRRQDRDQLRDLASFVGLEIGAARTVALSLSLSLSLFPEML